MDQNVALKLKAEQIKKTLREHPQFKYFTVKRGSILDELGRKTLFGSEAREYIADDLSRSFYNKDKVELLQKRYGFTLQKAKQMVDAFKTKGPKDAEIRQRYKWVREKVDGYLTPTIEKKIIDSISEGKKNIKQISKEARREQTIYHRRVAAGFTNYAGALREGRFAKRSEIKTSANVVEKVLSQNSGELQGRQVLGLSYDRGSAVSALANNSAHVHKLTGGAATAVDTEAHGVAAAIGSKQSQKKAPDKPGGVPSPLGGNSAPPASHQPPIGFSRRF